MTAKVMAPSEVGRLSIMDAKQLGEYILVASLSKLSFQWLGHIYLISVAQVGIPMLVLC